MDSIETLESAIRALSTEDRARVLDLLQRCVDEISESALQRRQRSHNASVEDYLRSEERGTARHESDGIERYYLRYPKLIIEVLSPSTAAIDLREKRLHYASIESIEEYVIVSQEDFEVLHHARTARWVPQHLLGGDAILELRSVGLCLPLAAVYDRALAAREELARSSSTRDCAALRNDAATLTRRRRAEPAPRS